jgi:Ca2+-binding RTX toxin-like protein
VKKYGTLGSENIVGTSTDDTIYGYGGGDTVHGGAGNDVIYGGAGQNWLYGDTGNDTIFSVLVPGVGYPSDHIDGGADSDTLFLQRDFTQLGLGSLSLDLSDPNKTVGLQDGTTITGIENLIFRGGDESDIVTGGIGNNNLDGNGGSDTLKGGNVADVLDGGSGHDFLYGNGGDDWIVSIDPDTIDGGAGIDTVFIYRDSATMSYNFALQPNSQTPQDIGDGTTLRHIEKLYFSAGSGNDHVTGGVYDDTLEGGAGDDYLDGGKGNDYLNGGDHHDYIVSSDCTVKNTINPDIGLIGDAGFDTIDGGNGNDQLFLGRLTSTENIQLNLTDPTLTQPIGDGGVTPHGLAGTTVVNIESVVFWGGSGNDIITGGRFSDKLFGGEGNDTLCGGTQIQGMANVDLVDGGWGNDKLIGGPGADHFIFDTPLSAGYNVDTITNFAVANDRDIQEDQIWLSDTIFTELSPNMDENSFDQFIHESPTGDLVYFQVPGGMVGTPFAHIDGGAQLQYWNFHIFDGLMGPQPS